MEDFVPNKFPALEVFEAAQQSSQSRPTETWDRMQYGQFILEKSGGMKGMLPQTYRFKTLEDAFWNAKLWMNTEYDIRILGPEGLNLDKADISLELMLLGKAA